MFEKKKTKGILIGFFVCFILLFSWGASLEAAPTTAVQASRVVRNWLALEAAPMGVKTAGRILRTETFYEGGAAGYHIVYLEPTGFVVVPADDLVEPIIAFFPNAKEYAPSDTNPAGALIHRDVTGRVISARALKNNESAQESSAGDAKKKWRMLETEKEYHGTDGYEYDISDIRVDPLIESTWNQGAVAGANCYNYYTPFNYVCGCVATAMAQLMRFHMHPSTGVGTDYFNIKVNNIPWLRSLRGGDGEGGAYDWDNMPLRPVFPTQIQCQAIGALTHDAGVSVNTNYTSSDSIADGLKMANALLAVFKYNNAKYAYIQKESIPSINLHAMVNPNLDAAYPVLFGIKGEVEGEETGHGIVADGYGYDLGTMYHHLNMGWGSQYDAWYNLPPILVYDRIVLCVYNVFPSGTGEIVSGRVTADDGSGIAGVHVTLSGGASRSATTNAKGIYAFAGIPSGTSYTVSVSKAGHTFTPSSRSVTTGESVDSTTTTGNRWQIDFSSAATATSYVFVAKWGGKIGDGNGEFSAPRSIAIDNDGNVYVADSSNNRIQKFGLSGAFLAKWGSSGNAEGQFNKPYGVAVDADGNVYVADTNNHRVQKFTSSGEFLTKWGSPGEGDGQFRYPRYIAVAADGSVYVTDERNYRVQKFTSSGVFLAAWGSKGSGDGQFRDIHAVAVDGDGNVYVTDSANDTVRKFSSSGILLAKWGNQGDGQFISPVGVCVNGNGDVFVSDFVQFTIRKFTSSGALLTQWGSEGSGNGQFGCPSGIAAASDGRVYVVDHGTNCVQVFAPAAPAPGAWVIGANGNTYRYEDGGWTWTPAKADYLTAVNKNACWISQTGSSTLYKYANGTWWWTPAKAKWVAAYGENSLWLVQATSDNLFRYEGGVWTWTPAKVKNISAPSSNVVWLIQRDSENLYKYTVSTNTWEWTPGKAKSISAATENVVWLVATNDHVYKYDHGAKSWTFHNIKAKSVSAVSSTEVMFVDMSGRLCRLKDGVASVIGGSCKDVSVYPIPALSGEAAFSKQGTSVHSSSSQGAVNQGGCSLLGGGPLMVLLFIPLFALYRCSKK